MDFRLLTPRLRLRGWRDADLTAFAAMNADPHVMEFFPAPLTTDQSAALFCRIRDELAAEGYGIYAVERRSDGRWLGFTGLHRVSFAGPLHDQVEIAWRLLPEAWGHGYATEAARACLGLAAKHGIESVVAFTTLHNLRSQRVMERLGMEPIGAFDHPELPAAHPLSRHVLYRITLG